MAAAFVACALALAPAAGASAHDYLVDSSPKADSVQTTPLKKVTLTFDDIVLDLAGNGSSALLQVTGPNGANTHFETKCPSISGRVVAAPVALGGPGKYVVSYQIVSADGHTVSNSLAFTYRPPAGTAEAAGSANRPACGGAKAGSSDTASSPNAQAQGASGSSLGIVVTLAIVIIGLAVIGVIIVLVTGRRRPRTARSPHETDDD